VQWSRALSLVCEVALRVGRQNYIDQQFIEAVVVGDTQNHVMYGAYNGHFQLHVVHFWWLDGVTNCLMHLPIVHHTEHHFKCQNKVETQKLEEVKMKILFLESLSDHILGPLGCVNYIIYPM
jgi:hypothetical protein